MSRFAPVEEACEVEAFDVPADLLESFNLACFVRPLELSQSHTLEVGAKECFSLRPATNLDSLVSSGLYHEKLLRLR